MERGDEPETIGDRLRWIGESNWSPATRATAGALAGAIDRAQRGEPAGDAGSIDVREVVELERLRLATRGITKLEILRDVLVFAPVAVTWYHLREAAPAYADYTAGVAEENAIFQVANAKATSAADLVPLTQARSFLSAWSAGDLGGTTFATVAAQVVILVGLVIALTMWSLSRRHRREAILDRSLASLGSTLIEGKAGLVSVPRTSDDGLDQELERSTAALRRFVPVLQTATERIDRAGGGVANASKVLDQSVSTLGANIDELRQAALVLTRQMPLADELAELREAAAAFAERTAEVAVSESTTADSVKRLIDALDQARRHDAARQAELSATVRSIGDWVRTAERVATYFRAVANSLEHVIGPIDLTSAAVAGGGNEGADGAPTAVGRSADA